MKIKPTLKAGGPENPEQFRQGVVEFVHQPFFEGNNGIVGNLNTSWADLRAAFRNVAVADPLLITNIPNAILIVKRMHLERRIVNEVPRTGVAVIKMMIAQNMANILAEIAFDAFAEFLYTVHVRLRHAPCTVRQVWLARSERLDVFFYLEVPGNIGNKVFNEREGPHRLDQDRLVERQRAQPRHAHQLGHTVDFRGAGTALSRLAVPAHSQVVSLGLLDFEDDVEHHHAGRNLRPIILKPGPLSIATPYPKRYVGHRAMLTTVFLLYNQRHINTSIKPLYPRSNPALVTELSFEQLIFSEIDPVAVICYSRNSEVS